MNHQMKNKITCSILWVLGTALIPPMGVRAAEVVSTATPSRPNIVIILADDLGYGDPRCFNEQSKIPTPNIDRLAREGMRFTDAHAAGSVCVPSRYGLLTGRYPFRNTGTKNPTQGALIEPQRATVATVLREAGYATAMIGKWHLGFDGGDQFDFSKPLRGGPCDHGFDSFFGQHASLDIPPYFFIANDRAVAPASEKVGESRSPDWSPIQGAFWRAGKIAANYKHPDVLPTYTRKAVEYLEAKPKTTPPKPFFLYLAFTAPHTPWLPMEAFRGKSLGGLYGDFVAQFDDSVGQVLSALDRAGLTENTLVFFGSDNGPVWLPADIEKFGHAAAGPWRGMKGDAWEGGHRMPFIARWPGKIRAGTTSAETICFTDLLATCAALSGTKPPDGAGEDSYDLTSILFGQKQDQPIRNVTIHESSKGGTLCIRQANWKLIPQLGSGGFSTPSKVVPKPGEPTVQLYNLETDPGETKNLAESQPQRIAEMKALLEKLITEGLSTP
jgi:arylsulfatase A-like enzyme